MKKLIFCRLIFILWYFALVSTVSGQRFETPLFIPDTLSGPDYRLEMDITRHDFGSAYKGIATFSYNQQGFLGPTIIWTYGDSVQMHVTNHIRQESTNHWHGAHVPPIDDGGPNQPIPAGTTWSPPKFKVLDPPCTMWYHPHLHMQTLAQVNMGLAGMIIIRDRRDPLEATFPHRYGVDEFPIILQDRHFIRGGTNYSLRLPDYIDTSCTMGHSFLVNGNIAPVLRVPAGMIRLRVLNGSSERGYMLAITDSTVLVKRNAAYRENDHSEDFKLIATDAGYTAKPYEVKSIMMGPGERSEWLVDLSAFPAGTSLYLSNLPELLPSSIPGSRDTNSVPGCVTLNEYDSFPTPLMRIEIMPTAAHLALLAMNRVPAEFHPLAMDNPDPAGATRKRHKYLDFYNPSADAPPFSIDSMNFNDNVINDTINLGDTEIWSISNISPVAHPFHIHDISFRILGISDAKGQNETTDIPPYLRGPKDVILVQSNQTIRFVAQFNDFSTPPCPHNGYMYHCHILSHEDGGMMHQFVVVDPKKKFPPCAVPTKDGMPGMKKM